MDIEQLDPKKYILIKRARVHNLKGVDVAIERNRLVVITGLSGSGKTSLAFDTLYAEGQRRYVESLSAYARQFLGRMHKPAVDYIKGISPAIAIEQKVNTRNPRSTVGTSTEVYDYLKLLFARAGKTYSPVSGKLVKRDTVTDVVNHCISLPSGTMALLMAPLAEAKISNLKQQLSVLLQQGFTRVFAGGEVVRIESLLDEQEEVRKVVSAVVIDRFAIDPDDKALHARIADSVQTAFYEGDGGCELVYTLLNTTQQLSFTNRYEQDGITFEKPSVNLFAFNNPFGACSSCEGFGSIIGIDPDLVVPNKQLSIYEDAIACWRGEKMQWWKDQLITHAYKFDFPIHKPYRELSAEHQNLVWKGNDFFKGLDDFFKMVEENTYKIQYRVMLSRYRGKTLCPDCRGTRLREDAGYVKIDNHSIADLVLMPLDRLQEFFRHISLTEEQAAMSRRLLLEIISRLAFLNDVGLGYLTLNRLSNTLSGGESQRINLATSLGSSLVGSLYILDEPSIGLHQRDNARLIKVLKTLRDQGNTVIVVEHDEAIIRAADQVVDIGPLAGTHGGSIVFQGSPKDLLRNKNSLTAQYLNKEKEVALTGLRRKWKEYIQLTGVRQHNLKGFDVKIPLHIMTVISGVSGSGKSTLVKNILYPALKKHHGGYGERIGLFDSISGDLASIQAVEYIDQHPIGKSSRSNPATYLKAYDEVRQLFASRSLAKSRGYKPGAFSFNVEGGRCPECEGEGSVKIGMQFMADIVLECDSCKGTRFKDEILDVTFEGKHIADVLNMTVDDAIAFFNGQSKSETVCKRIADRIQPLADVGLGYIRMGQASSTLSGGEAQRIKLAAFLTKGGASEKTLFVFDEPTTGLHFHDIEKLLAAFVALIDNGHTILVIEHNPEVIKSADWIIDLGPEGGDRGGGLVFEGTPEELIKCPASLTGQFLSH